jgi:hypothetical protein
MKQSSKPGWCGTYSTSSAKSREIDGVHHPKAAGTRRPFNDQAHERLKTLDQVGVVINTEKTRDLATNTDTVYKKNFRKKGYAAHASQKKEGDHPVKIYAPEVTPAGNPRYPWKRPSKF